MNGNVTMKFSVIYASIFLGMFLLVQTNDVQAAEVLTKASQTQAQDQTPSLMPLQQNQQIALRALIQQDGQNEDQYSLQSVSANNLTLWWSLFLAEFIAVAWVALHEEPAH